MKKYLLVVTLIVLCLITACGPGSGSGSTTLTDQEECWNDALKIRNAAAMYCAENECASDIELEYSDVDIYIDTFDSSTYDFTATNDVVAIQQGTGPEWFVTLERDGTGEYEFPFNMDPANGSATTCSADTN